MSDLAEAIEEARANQASAWAELSGYVQQAAEDGTQIDPAGLLAYMTELRRRANRPVADWMRSVMAPARCGCGRARPCHHCPEEGP